MKEFWNQFSVVLVILSTITFFVGLILLFIALVSTSKRQKLLKPSLKMILFGLLFFIGGFTLCTMTLTLNIR